MVTVEEDKLAATPDVKNAPVTTDFQPSEDKSDHNVENSESPDKDLSSSKAEVLPASETQASSANENEGNPQEVSRLLI